MSSTLQVRRQAAASVARSLPSVIAPLIVLAAATASAAGMLAAAETPATQQIGGVERDGGGSITGVVLFRGPRPERAVNAALLGHAFCKKACADNVPLDERWVFGSAATPEGERPTLANVLVYVSKGLEGQTFAPSSQPVVLDQVACVYIPRVVGVMAGQTLEVRNSDATLHNVMASPRKNRGFNDGMPVKDGRIEKVFAEPEFNIGLRCVLHPWMQAYVHVLPHPYFAVTGMDGAFTLRGLPPGDYELSVRHEATRFAPDAATVSATVAPGHAAQAAFVFSDRQADATPGRQRADGAASGSPASSAGGAGAPK